MARTASFQGNDGSGANNLSNIATRNINVTSVNDAPAGTDKTITINEDTP